jgi:hypothetical protein
MSNIEVILDIFYFSKSSLDDSICYNDHCYLFLPVSIGTKENSSKASS